MKDMNLENAVRFISNTLLEKPDAERLPLIEDASRRFNLSPVQTQHLLEKYVSSK